MSEHQPTPSILIERDGPIMRVTLNRPEKRNALNGDMFAGLLRAAEEISADSGVRALIVGGAGKAFCAGGDLSGLPERHGEADFRDREEGFRSIQAVFDRIESVTVPSIAAIQGYALGAGLQLALACDFRIAAEDARLGLPDVKNGIIPGLGATTRLPRLIGLARTKAMIMTGEPITAQKALDIGLVNEVVSLPDLEDAADRLLQRAPLALCAAKHLLNSEAGLDEVAAVQMRLMATADAREGVAAFFEKRRPHFTGR